MTDPNQPTVSCGHDDDSVLGSHDSFWTVACREGRWGTVTRPTFVSHAES